LSEKTYIKAILPLRLEWEPCYCLEADLFSAAPQVRVGDRIRVRFARREYIAVVSEVGVTPDVDPGRISPIISVENGLSSISAAELKLWRFIAEYYLCSIGEVYRAAYPPAKVVSEQVQMRIDARKEAFRAKQIDQWDKRLGVLRGRLEAKDAALAKPHKESVAARLGEERAKIVADIAKAEKALEGLNESLEIEDFSAGLGRIDEGVGGSDCFGGAASGLAGGGLVDALGSGKPVLFKSTERFQTYISLAADCLRKGKNVLLIVPEISQAKKLQIALSQTFGELLLVHHSSETPVRRRKIADAVRGGKPYLLLGTRSSIFLPFSDLGLIIVDSEQSPFYKQTDSAPRYNCRDCAIVLGSIHDASVLLGSCSPSLESLYNVECGKYEFVAEAGRSSGRASKRRFSVIDIPAERTKRGMMDEVVSRKLYEKVRACEGRIAIIRGFEKEDALAASLQSLFPDLMDRIQVLTIPEARVSDFSAFDLCAMTSGDALFDKGDFRSDERAFQFLETLLASGAEVVVQTFQGKQQVFKLDSALPLLDERRAFNLPPFTRLVDIQALAPLGSCTRLASSLRTSLRLSCSDPIPVGTGNTKAETDSTVANGSSTNFQVGSPSTKTSKTAAGGTVISAKTAANNGTSERYLLRITLPRDSHLAATKTALKTHLTTQKFRTLLDVDPV